LSNHDRTILSAKFGDGKSYFLQKSAKMMAAFLMAQKTVGKIKKKAGELMEPVRDRQIENFIKEIAKNPVSGQDVVTEIIQQGIAAYKDEHPDKKIVLVIEDMDRMDPAHLFRILNVFSAHIDYNYRFGVNSNQPFVGNKFGLNKVVFVMSFENTEHIFHHLYGEGSDFNGYISKFCSSNIFCYSFSSEKEECHMIPYTFQL